VRPRIDGTSAADGSGPCRQPCSCTLWCWVLWAGLLCTAPRACAKPSPVRSQRPCGRAFSQHHQAGTAGKRVHRQALHPFRQTTLQATKPLQGLLNTQAMPRTARMAPTFQKAQKAQKAQKDQKARGPKYRSGRRSTRHQPMPPVCPDPPWPPACRPTSTRPCRYAVAHTAGGALGRGRWRPVATEPS
jgi:hypothetical protein